MDPTPLTLFEFFKVRSCGDIVSQALKSADQNELKGIPGFGWNLVKNKLGDAFREMLDIKMVDIFCHAFILLPELQDWLDRDQYPPGKIFHKELANITIRSEHHPKLEILLKQQRVAELTFDVELKLKLNGFVLKIQDGRIREIATGTCQGVGTIACRGQELASETTPKYQLPGNMVLEPGIQIPRLAEPKPLQQPKLRRSFAGGGNSLQPRQGHPVALLVGIDGPVRGRQFYMDKVHFRIGRNADNDLCIDSDDNVSRYHACLSYEKGSLFLSDQDSKNGTFLNEKEVMARPIVIRRGDHIRLGDSEFQIQ